MVRVISVFLLMVSFAFAGDGFSFVGTNKCKMCHKTASKGDQFGLWNATKHAGALETLKSDAALVIAKERGIDGAPSESPECLPCHTVGFGAGGYEVLSADFIADEANKKAVKRNTNLEGVGCEACHGPGSKYKSKKTMVGLYDNTIEDSAVGFETPSEETCKTCHNENSPTAKEFDYAAMVAKIAHPYPEGFTPGK